MPTAPRRTRTVLAAMSLSATSILATQALPAAPASAATTTTFVSDLPRVAATNGLGPAEKDRSNGTAASGDGRVLRLAGRTFAKGLGVHAGSSLTYRVPVGCSRFTATIGVDDSMGAGGSVVFRVYNGSRKAYDSGKRTGLSRNKAVSVPVSERDLLRLVVTDWGDGRTRDHADWANARLTCATQPAPVARIPAKRATGAPLPSAGVKTPVGAPPTPSTPPRQDRSPSLTTTAPTAPSSMTAARRGDFETDFAEWDLGGASVAPNPGASVTRDTTLVYEGTSAAKAYIPRGDGNKFARTLWGNSSGQSGALNYGEGKDFTYGMALYLPQGFYASMQSYFVPMRWDNFGVTNVSRSGLSMWSDGTMRLFRERAGIESQVNLLGSATFRLAEGQWHWLEVRQKLSSRDGSAINEVRVNNQLIGSSTTANYYGEPVSAIRFGIVALSGAQNLPLMVRYDRAVLGTGRLGAKR